MQNIKKGDNDTKHKIIDKLLTISSPRYVRNVNEAVIIKIIVILEVGSVK